MYKCEWCGCEFEEPKKITEEHGFRDGRHETFYVCPECGDTYKEAKECANCGTYHIEDGALCKECQQAFNDELNRLMALFGIETEEDFDDLICEARGYAY